VRLFYSDEKCPACGGYIAVMSTVPFATGRRHPTGAALLTSKYGSNPFYANDGDRAEYESCGASFEVYDDGSTTAAIPAEDVVRVCYRLQRCGGDGCRVRGECVRFLAVPRLPKRLAWVKAGDGGEDCQSFLAIGKICQ